MPLLLACLLSTAALADPLDDLPEPEDPIESEAPPEIDGDLFEEDEETAPSDPSETAEGYRAMAGALALLPADEEVEAWEQYLRDHPESAFRARIQQRIELLMDQIYDEGLQEEVVTDDRELRLAQGVLLEDFDPRTRVKVGFQWGLPDLLDLSADYEHALHRQFSVHGGMRNRLTGWSFEGGARFAPVKSVSSGTIVTLIADARYNALPGFAALRPMLAAGQRIGRFDLALQGGADIEIREGASPTWLGGGNVTFRASDRVRFFAEGAVNMRHLDWPGGSFQFNTVAIGLEFLMAGKAEHRDAIVADLGAWVPFFYRWWIPAYGAAFGRADFYLDDL